MLIEVYSDGSATTDDKPGGYGWVMVIDGKKHAEGNGHMPNASNNDAEMEAAIMGLANVFKFLQGPELTQYMVQCQAHPGPPEVYLVSDSRLILGWTDGSYRFKQLDKIEKYHKLQRLVKTMGVKTRWVRGHSGDEHNERCDKLANAARTGKEAEEEKAAKELNGDTLIGTRKGGIVCLWYKNSLKIVDLVNNVCEDYSREVHGPRGSLLEIREEKSR